MASFLFNSARLEHPYGVSLFDDLHNYLPEILYDNQLFDNQLVPFIQRRVQDLFSEDFSRNRTQYRLFQQSRRRADSGLMMPVTMLYPLAERSITPPPIRRTVNSVPRTPVAMQPTVSVPQPPRAPRPVWTARTHTAMLDPANLTDGISAILLSALGAGSSNMQNLEQMLGAGFLNAVVVAPTDADLQRATFVTSVEPAADVVCPICQDHTSEENTTREWRYIRHCNHAFHRTCIDRWFQEHVHCPVCRFDIRETETQTES